MTWRLLRSARAGSGTAAWYPQLDQPQDRAGRSRHRADAALEREGRDGRRLPGVIGSFFGGPILYIQRGGDQLVVHGILVQDDEANQAKLLQIGQTAAARW